MSSNVTGQDPNAHLFYEVDWTKWMAKRGFLTANIISALFTVPAPAVMTSETRTGAVARVTIKDIPAGKETKVLCRISVTNPAGGAALTDDFTFTVVGRSS